MKLLLDTHIWLWWNANPTKLSTSVLAQISDSDNEVYFSAASVWEMAIKARIGKLPLSDSVANYVATRLKRDRFRELPITHVHAAAVENLPLLHRDPFDRLLIVQSRSEGMRLITGDDEVLAYGGLIVDGRR